MSTVAPSTSNIERSPHFLSRQALGKAQAANPLAQAFAALLQSAEQSDARTTTDQADPLTDDTQPAADNKKNETPFSAADAGQAALAGLLNWQTLSAGASAPQHTAAAVTNEPVTPLDASANIQPGRAEALTADANELPMSATNLSNTANPLSLHDAAATSSPSTSDAPQQISTKYLPATDTSQVSTAVKPPSTDAIQTSAPVKVDSLTQPVAKALADTSATGTSPATDAIQTSAPVKVDSLPQPVAKALADTSSTGTPPATDAAKSPVPAGTFHWMAEAQAANIERPHISKPRAGNARNPLPTATATSKSGTDGRLPDTTLNVAANGATALPRATVDLAVRTAPTASSNDAESVASTPEPLLFKLNSAQAAVPNAASGTENAQANEHAPASLASAESTGGNNATTAQMTQIMDEVSGQIAHWAAQGNQQASLTLGKDTDNPLEISIAMRDGEVHVAFEAAQGDIRDALQASAEALLKNRLEGQGMTLGDVTVSQRQASAQQDAPTSDNRNTGEPPAGRGVANTSARSNPARGTGLDHGVSRRADIATAEKVDLFA